MNYFEQDCFRYNVLVELSPIELEEIYKDKLNPLNKHTEDTHFLTLLCEKWNIENVEIFDKFFLSWNLKYLFSSFTTLEYQLENYKKYFTVSKAASKASRNSCQDFCEALLDEYPDNEKILYNIHKNYVYRENALELISELSVEDKYSIWHKCNSQEKFAFEDFNRVGDNTFVNEYQRHFLTVADIAFRRPLRFEQTVDLLSIASFLKDPSVLTDPYYLKHPNVDTTWTYDDLLTEKCHQLLRACKGDNDCHLINFPLSEKSCKVFEEIGLPRGMYMTLKDKYSYCWMKEHGSKYGFTTCKVEVSHILGRNTSTIVIGGVDHMVTILYKDKTCPSFYEFIRSEITKTR